MSLFTLIPILSSTWEERDRSLCFLGLLCGYTKIMTMNCFVNSQVLWMQVLYPLLRETRNITVQPLSFLLGFQGEHRMNLWPLA